MAYKSIFANSGTQTAGYQSIFKEPTKRITDAEYNRGKKQDEEKEKTRKRAIDEGLNRGMSWENIAKQTNLPLDEIKNYSQSTRPDYGTDTRSSFTKIKQAAAGVVDNFGGAIESVIQDASGGTKRREQQYELKQAQIEAKKREIKNSGVLSNETKSRILGELESLSESIYNKNKSVLSKEQKQATNVTNNPILRGGAAFGAGVKRSGEGVAQGVGGIYDLATPGKGQSRLTQAATRSAEGSDKFVQDNQLNDIAYKGGQLTGEVLQLLSGAELTKLASKAPAIAKISSATERAAEWQKAVQKVAKGNKAAEAALKTVSYVANPQRVANMAANTAVDQGQISARGQDISAGSVAQSAGLNYALGGVLDVASAGLNKVANRNADKITVFSGGKDDTGWATENKRFADQFADTTKGLPKPSTTPQIVQNASKVSARPEAIAKRTGVQTSRVKQFYDSAQRDLVGDIETSGVARTGQRQAVVDTYAAAVERGPINLTSVQVGDKIDAVDVVRARMTMGTYLDDVQKAIKSGDSKAIANSKDELDKALNGYRVLTGEAGRATQIQSTFDNKAVKAFEAISDYQKTIADGGKLSRGQIKYMDDLLEEMTGDAQLTRTDKFKSALYAGDTSLVRKLEEYATSAKLTSPTTHVRNIIGNTLTFGQRAVEQSIATTIGAARGRTSIRALTRSLGTRSGYKEATQKFMGVMNDAVRLRQTTTNMVASEGYNQAIGGKIGEAIRIPFKLLEATDEFGKTILRDSKLHQEAFDLAYREGVRGDALKNRVAELVQNPTKKMMASAEKDALEFTFQKDLGKVGKGFQSIVSSIPGGKLFIPFIRTPTNIVKFQLQRSIAGAPGQVVQGFAKKGTREGDEAIAKAITGTLFSLGTYSWVRDNSDRITGAAPTSQSDRDAFYADGKQPYSIKVGDKWVSYQSFQPVGMYLLQAKSLADAVDKNDNKSAVNIASGMVQVAAKGMLELPFVQGMNNIFEVLGNPEQKAEDFVASTVKGLIPNAVRDVRLYTDEVVRAPKDLKEQIFDMIPGLSAEIAPRKNVIGDTATRKDSPLARSLFRVFGSKEQIPKEEFEILKGISKNEGYSVGRPGRTQRGKKLDNEQYQAYQDAYYEAFGTKLSSVVGQGWFINKSWEDKRKEIEKMVREAGDETRDALFGEK